MFSADLLEQELVKFENLSLWAVLVQDQNPLDLSAFLTGLNVPEVEKVLTISLSRDLPTELSKQESWTNSDFWKISQEVEAHMWKKHAMFFQTSQTSQSMPSVYVCGVQVRRETYHTASLGNPIPCHLPVWPPMQVKVLAKGKYAVLIDGFRYLRDDQTLARLISLVGLAAGTLELI
jgi:hypothetical protein